MKCFSVKKTDIDDRLDCFFYQPEFVQLEKQIRNISKLTLNDFIISISSGATPNKNDADKYYTDSKSGFPMLRVQNITAEGINFENCVYINSDTHDGLLKRSQVSEYDLLTKITGVGRMAISSVAPKGFKGNVNQHIVVIKTKNAKTSHIVAAFLNSDIGEKLASRYATGGTRPALDYKTLRKIPIVYDPQIVDLMKIAYAKKQRKLQRAQESLNSIDGYVLEKLGIELPNEKENCIENRIFVRKSRQITGNRCDPLAYDENRISAVEAIGKSIYPVKPLKSVVCQFKKTTKEFNKSIPYVGLKNIVGNEGLYVPTQIKDSISSANSFLKGQILFPKLRPYLNKVYLAEFNGICSTEFHVFDIGTDFDNIFLSHYLRSKIIVRQTSRLMTGNTLPRLQISDILQLTVPIPPVNIQKKIAGEVKSRTNKAKQLRAEAEEILERAKQEVEQMILRGKSK